MNAANEQPRDPHTDPNSVIARVGGVWAGADLQRNFQAEVAALLHRNQRSFPGAQPVSFGAKHLTELKREDYYVCEKTDGIRYLMYLTEENDADIHYLIDRKNDYYYVRGLHFPHHEDKSFQKYHKNTILDGELVEDKYPDRPPVMKFLVFDCLVLDGNSLLHRPLDKRLAYFKSHVLEPYKSLFRTYPNEFRPFVVEDKSTEFSYGLEKMFKEIIPKVKQLHGNDGLIFTCKNSPYRFGTDEHILKWKPPEENTVDFLLHIVWPTIPPDPNDPDQSLQEDYLAFPTDFGLYVYYGHDGDYEPHGSMHVEPDEWETIKADATAESRNLQHAIVECYLETVPSDSNGAADIPAQQPQKRWRFHRLRTDKMEANHISTFNSVIDSIEDHVTEADLLTEADDIRREWKARDAKKKGGENGSATGSVSGSERRGTSQGSQGGVQAPKI